MRGCALVLREASETSKNASQRLGRVAPSGQVSLEIRSLDRRPCCRKRFPTEQQRPRIDGTDRAVKVTLPRGQPCPHGYFVPRTRTAPPANACRSKKERPSTGAAHPSNFPTE